MSYTDAAPVFAALREDLWPTEFRGKSPAVIEQAWPAWVMTHDAAIRARLAAGEEDSVVHFLLFGTSFTTAPRISARELAALAVTPDTSVASLGPRIDALVEAAAGQRADERLQLVREVFARAGIDLAAPNAKAQARQYLNARAKALGGAGLQRLEATVDAAGGSATIFRDRGLSSDTTVSTNLGIERALIDLEAAGVLRRGMVRRAAIIGPGLDFVDKQFGYDFYPPQTVQPFALVDSLLHLGLAAAPPDVSAFDVSLRVNGHLTAARDRALDGRSYRIALPRAVDQTWTPELIEYWKRLGSAIGDEERASPPPDAAGRVQVRTVAIRPPFVAHVHARDLDVVLERAAAASDEDRFDLVIATNVLLYYDVFEQSLALANISAMLRKGGVLLSNTRVLDLPGLPIAQTGHTDVVYMRLPGVGEAGDRVFWYVRQ